MSDRDGLTEASVDALVVSALRRARRATDFAGLNSGSPDCRVERLVGACVAYAIRDGSDEGTELVDLLCELGECPVCCGERRIEVEYPAPPPALEPRWRWEPCPLCDASGDSGPDRECER